MSCELSAKKFRMPLATILLGALRLNISSVNGNSLIYELYHQGCNISIKEIIVAVQTIKFRFALLSKSYY